MKKSVFRLPGVNAMCRELETLFLFPPALQEELLIIEITTLPVVRGKVPLRVARGHFATSHSHINYFIDIAK